MKKFLMCLMLILCVTSAQAKRHRHLKSGFALIAPSRNSLVMQNQMIDQLGLVRIGDEKELAKMVEDGKLVALPNNAMVSIASSLPSNRRYVLPTTRDFLSTIAQQYYAEFHLPLQVDSAIRSRDVQRKLHRRNASAAPVDGETASSHEAGCTIDISRHMIAKQTHWLEWRLAYYQAIGQALVEEERHCFHIMCIKEIQ